MPGPHPIDPRFLRGPFATDEFLAAGYSAKMLYSKRFTRCHPRVWVATRHVMSPADRRHAARLALPSRARMTDITRIQELGLDFGEASPMHFAIDTDLHIDLDGIMLHRTVEMPPSTEGNVSPAAAFVAYCSHATLIDAVAVGDWLLHWKHMALAELAELVTAQPWRRGARQARWIYPMLVPKTRSPQESKLRVSLLASGISGLEVNAMYDCPDGTQLEIDLLARRCNFAVEYEGGHHQTERRQYLKDIDRYARFRDMGLHYRLITAEHLHNPKTVVINVYQQLLTHGYDGPLPNFGPRWLACFAPIQPGASGDFQPTDTGSVGGSSPLGSECGR